MDIGIESLAGVLELSNLSSTARLIDIESLCKAAVQHGCAGTMVNPCFLSCTIKNTVGMESMVRAAGMSYPFGCDLTSVKVYGAKQLEIMGAQEISVVMNHSAFLSGNTKYVRQEIEALCECVKLPVNIMVESSKLSEAELSQAALIISKTRAASMQDGTGLIEFAPNAKAIEIMREALPEEICLKSAAGFEHAQEMLDFAKLGVERFRIDAAKAELVFAEIASAAG